MQLIPSMDLLDGRLVRLRHGDPRQASFYAHSPEAWMEELAAAGATRVHLVDLNGAFGGQRQRAFSPYPTRFPGISFQLGGGLRTQEAVQEALDLGFEAVIGTLAVEHPTCLKALPPERLIVALDLRNLRLVTQGWLNASPCDLKEVAGRLLEQGLSRALVTDVGRDGTLEGPGLEAVALIAGEGFQVQASGGLRNLADVEALRALPGVVGAICGKALLEGLLPLSDLQTRAALQGAF